MILIGRIRRRLRIVFGLFAALGKKGPENDAGKQDDEPKKAAKTDRLSRLRSRHDFFLYFRAKITMNE